MYKYISDKKLEVETRRHDKTEFRKILTDNTILEQQNIKQRLQILKALHIRNKYQRFNGINFQCSTNVLKCL